MKLKLIVIFTLTFFGFSPKPGNAAFISRAFQNTVSIDGDSSRLRISNNSSLKRLPSILRDLTIAIAQSSLQQQQVLNENGFNIDLHDAFCKNFDTSATVTYQPGDSVFYLKLNRLNRQASDRALAVTLIHEIMHCILLDIDKRGRSGESNALSIIKHFNETIQNPSAVVCNNFFDLMNRSSEGQHELMYQLFFPDMVSLLERFAVIHKQSFLQHETAEILMWSGLQGTSGFQNLSVEERKQIQLFILQEKGIPVAFMDN